PGETALGRRGALLGLVGALIRRCALVLHVAETVADEGPERGAEDEPYGPAGDRTDRGAAAEPDRLFRSRGLRLGRAVRRGPARGGQQAAGHQDDDLFLHDDSLIEACGCMDTLAFQRTALIAP